jgi:hypothetical protein
VTTSISYTSLVLFEKNKKNKKNKNWGKLYHTSEQAITYSIREMIKLIILPSSNSRYVNSHLEEEVHPSEWYSIMTSVHVRVTSPSKKI